MKKEISKYVLKETDIIIVGGSYVGLSLAISIKIFSPHLKIIIIDAKEIKNFNEDPRSSAITASVVRMLNIVGCWKFLSNKSEPIRKISITDSKIFDPIRSKFLTFLGDVNLGEPFAYTVENRHLKESLYSRIQELDINRIENTKIKNFKLKKQNIYVYLQDNSCIRGKLIVGSDGKNSIIRKISRIKTYQKLYNQSSIICNICHERPHYGYATQHFFSSGPFAILPLQGNRSSIIWNEQHKRANDLINSNLKTFEKELRIRIGNKLGEIQIEGMRYVFPLELKLSSNFIGKRFVLAGDSAHRIHPIAGQGLNLGFRDSAALAEVIIDASRLGLDIGEISTLERYQIWRRFEIVSIGFISDILNSIFSNNYETLSFFRKIGLSIIDRSPKIKKFLIQQSSGLKKGSPKLLMGKNI